jgi:hypothetical protein
MRTTLTAVILVLLPLGTGWPAESGNPDIAAQVGDLTITLEEVDRKAMATNLNAYQALYTARMKALDEIIAEQLLQKAAAGRGITVEELVRTEITEKVKPVTDADVETFYNQNRARMGNRTLEMIQGQIRTFLEQQNLLEARRSFLDQIKGDAEIRISLEVPRAEVRIASHDPVKGPDGAKVTIVEFSDFQ